MHYKNILKQNPLFSCFDEKELEQLAEIAEIQYYQKNKCIINEGDTSASLYIIAEGKANAFTLNHKRKKMRLNSFEKGDYFGEMSFIDGEPRCASVETEEDTELLVIPRNEFRRIFSSHPHMSDILLKGLLQKLRRATKEVSPLMELMAKQELRDADMESVRRLVLAAEYKDKCTGGHIFRISQYSGLLAEKIGFSAEKTECIRNASSMHDIGKIGIPDRILLKPGRLTEDEFDEIKKHTIIGANILRNPRSELLQCAKTIVESHHEKFNGKGYPKALKGMQIPVEARIVAIVDAFDAITSDRPYEPALSTDEAVERIKKDRGTHFDPEITDVFINHIDEIEKIKKLLQDIPNDFEDRPYKCDDTFCRCSNPNTG
ncbi:MAG: cyclic nucleotide-binding domain-containing protein [Desulfobacterales bacterium]